MKKGFTLIELLVVVTMIIMLMAAIVTAMTSTFRAQTKVNLSNKAMHNGSYALAEIKKNILNADAIGMTCPDATQVIFNNVIDGDQTTIICDSVNKKIASISAKRPTDIIDLTSKSEVSVVNCNNFVVCETGSNGVVTGLNINFTLSSGTTQPNYIERSFNTKISVRN
jgi:type II secretory pathway pseudopilin PulG